MIREMIENAVLNNERHEEITAHFRDGRAAVYTSLIFDLLKTDPAVEMIIDTKTGEILFPEDF